MIYCPRTYAGIHTIHECMNMKEMGPRSGERASLAPPLDPPMQLLRVGKKLRYSCGNWGSINFLKNSVVAFPVFHE